MPTVLIDADIAVSGGITGLLLAHPDFSQSTTTPR
jgi:hypothetical protein